MPNVTLYPGDNIQSLRRLAANSIDSVVCDPPYLLTSIAKRFGKEGSAAARTEGNDGSFARLSGGFMGRKWDSPNVEMPEIDADFANYMAGLIDGEGCFSVHKKQVNGYETFDCQFSITMRADDAAILYEMQRRLEGAGSIAIRDKETSNPQVRYCISSKRDCYILREVLLNFPLRAKKARDFEIWCHALDAWLAHEVGGTWEDMEFYRDQIMLVKRFGSFFKPELLFHYRWSKEVFRVLKPGGYIFAFSGSRTGHWQAAAMETAGFIMHPMHGWCFGSGFPKAHAADKAIDKALGVEGGFIADGAPVKRMIPGADQHRDGSWIKDNGREYQPGSYLPGSPEAAQWEGWAYGTQAQKPALEPIYLGQKPFSEKTGAANLLKHGVGAVNIDGCRVPTEGEVFRAPQSDPSKRSGTVGSDLGISRADTEAFQAAQRASIERTAALGRHPANLILDGSPDVVAMFPHTKSGKPSGVRKANGWVLGKEHGTELTGFGDEGSAARFFHNFQPDPDPIIYHPKAGKQDRAGSNHPTVKPIALMQYLVRHITPPGGVVLDPFAGSGTTAEAAQREGFDCILMEAEPEYVEFLEQRFKIDSDVCATESHPYLELLGIHLSSA